MNPQTKAELERILAKYDMDPRSDNVSPKQSVEQALSALQKVIDAEVVRELENIEEVGHGGGNWRRILSLAIAARKEKQ